MKKLILTFAAIGMFFTATQAQVMEETTTETTTTQTTTAQDDFQKLEVAELPTAVNTAITRDYDGASAQEVWVKEKDSKQVYKIKLNVSGEDKTVYADAQGNWIDMKDKKDKKKDS